MEYIFKFSTYIGFSINVLREKCPLNRDLNLGESPENCNEKITSSEIEYGPTSQE